MKVLLVDDDERRATALAAAMRGGGHEVFVTPTVGDALLASSSDLVLLDLDLLDRDDRDVCAILRSRGDLGIVVVGGHRGEADRVRSLRHGADDHLCRPFAAGELIARIEAVMRRVRPGPAGERVLGELHLDLDRHEVWAAGQLIRLNRKEFQILRMLSDQPGTVLPRRRLVAEIWQAGQLPNVHTLYVHVARLRAKLGGSVRVQAVRGVGYRLAAPA